MPYVTVELFPPTGRARRRYRAEYQVYLEATCSMSTCS